MAKIISVDHGAPNWDEVENGNFQSLNTEVTEMISDTGWVTDGITLVNGTTVKDNDSKYEPMYRVVTLLTPKGIAKLVTFRATVTGCTAPSPIINFPDIFAPHNKYTLGFSLGDKDYRATFWASTTTSNLYLDQLTTTSQTVSSAGITITGSFMY